MIRDGEFSKVVSDHLRLDLNLIEFLSRVNTNDGADHLRDDNHVSEVSLDKVWLLIWLGLLLCLAQLLNQTHRLAFKTTVEPTAGTSMNDIAELVGGKIEEPL
jgi:hypothetical protein